MRNPKSALGGCLAALALAGCSTTGVPSSGPSAEVLPSAASSAASPPATTSPGEPTASEPTLALPREPSAETAIEAVHHLAGEIGPRPATSPAYAEAADWVESELRGHGYRVIRQRLRVPAGVTWGVPVPAGTATTVVARAPGTQLDAPYLLVGAHLDTVPQAPGGEDNASGVGALLAVAEAIAGRRVRLPVVLVAFAAEEPRGPSDDDHHYGSRRFVASLSGAERRALRGMVSLDRVGVGSVVPVCSATGLNDPLRRPLVRAAGRVGVPVVACVNRSSDHWSFVRDGLPGVRLGATSYAEYHSAADTADVVRREQLARVARLVVAWVSPR